MHPDWLNYINRKRRKNLLQTLQELSKLQDKENLNFILIGAFPLLIKGYLNYTAYWDIDLLFRNNNSLKKFIEKAKSKTLKIVDYDDDLVINKNIASLHTAWAFNHGWVNVDYILRKGFFEFYTHNIDALKPYKASIKTGNENFLINLYIAHPWDIVAEKVISPRTDRDIVLKIDMSVDIRHIFAIYKQEKDNRDFWHYILEKAKLLKGNQEFKTKFLKILSCAKELGYTNLKISPLSIKELKTREYERGE